MSETVKKPAPRTGTARWYTDHAVLGELRQEGGGIVVTAENMVLPAHSAHNSTKRHMFARVVFRAEKAACSIEVPGRRYIRPDSPAFAPGRQVKIRRTPEGFIYKSEMNEMFAGLADSDILSCTSAPGTLTFTLAAEDMIYAVHIRGEYTLTVESTAPVPPPTEADYNALLRFMPLIERTAAEPHTPLHRRIFLGLALKLLRSGKLSRDFVRRCGTLLIPKMAVSALKGRKG